MRDRGAAVILVATLTVHAACAAKPRPSIQPPALPPPAPATAPEDLIVLLPDADGTLGGATVSNSLGATELNAANTATRVSADHAPSPVSVVNEVELHRMFAEALSALPPPPQRFTLYFRFESEQLTAESRERVQDILEAVMNRPVPEVAVVGHTDTTGAAARNVQLGFKRAQAVREILIASGLKASSIEVTSHGETDPLVPTADEVLEPRNRRVDITVR